MNNKKINIVFLILIVIVGIMIFGERKTIRNVKKVEVEVMHKTIIGKKSPKKQCRKKIFEKENILTESETIRNEFWSKLESIDFSSKKEWFISYKRLLEEYKDYSDYLEIPKSVYEEYNIDEIKVFQKLVSAETTGGDFESKCNVASVVWNRIYSEKYPDNIIDVIYERNGSVQFTPTYDGRINIVEVTEDDVLAIEYTYMFGSTAYDCIAFDNVPGNSWNKNKLEEVFTDSINHTFYR